jgi:heme oxygenase
MISDAHCRLRAATQDHHQRLEEQVDILGRIATPEGRRDLVEGFSGLHADAEAALAPWLADLPGLDFQARRRSAHLARDLAVVGGAAPTARPIAVRGVAEALGLMYVLEGSTLGGRVIRKQVAARGGDMAGLSFLDPYGERVGERWRSFLSVLGDEPDTDALVAGALAGFRHAEDRLCTAAARG